MRHHLNRYRIAAVGSAILLGFVGALAPTATTNAASYGLPSTRADCTRGGWQHYTHPTFRNQGQCLRWVQRVIINNDCNPQVIDDFAVTAQTYASQLGISLERFIVSVCHGQDFPVSNNSYVVNSQAGTNLVSLASGNTTPFITKPGYIYWIETQGAWHNGATQQADAKYISNNNWTTHQNGPSFDQRNLEVQVNHQFVDWGAYNSGHNYNHWINGNGQPINMRVFEGLPFINLPIASWYADNTGPTPSGDAMPAIVFEYKLQ